MGEATWADVAPEDLGRAQARERWRSGHRVTPQLAMLWWYLAVECYPAWGLQREFLPHRQVRRLSLWGLASGLSGNSLTRLNLGLSLGLAEGGEFQKAMRLLVISTWAGRQEGLLISASCAVIPESWSLHAAECQNWTKPDASYCLASSTTLCWQWCI